MSAWLWVAIIVTAIAIVLELVDRLKTPLPWWRMIRGPLAGALALAWAVLVFRKTDKPAPILKKVKPKEYDDAKIIEIEKDAADLDVDAAGDAAAAPTLEELQSDLDAL